ncbi:MAG: SurA N-terminal domain-containing protein [Gaiellaceae bacterium]
MVPGRHVILFAVALGLAGCGGSSNKPVAVVGDQKITQKQLQTTVEHFREEARREGRLFPKGDTAAFRRIQAQLVRLLVYRVELEVAAARIGVHVSDKQVERQLAKAGSEAAGARGDKESFLRETARTQLVTEAVFRKVTAGIEVTPAEIRAYYRAHRRIYGATPYSVVKTAIESQLLSARKNAAMARWVAGARRSLGPSVRYELK